MNRSMPGLPVHHQLLEFTQTHVHRVGDAIQPSHPWSSPSPAPNPSQHQGLFQWINSLHEVAKVLEFQHQHQSLQWTPRNGLLYLDYVKNWMHDIEGLLVYLYFLKFNWSIVDLQCSGIQQSVSVIYICMCIYINMCIYVCVYIYICIYINCA